MPTFSDLLLQTLEHSFISKFIEIRICNKSQVCLHSPVPNNTELYTKHNLRMHEAIPTFTFSGKDNTYEILQSL